MALSTEERRRLAELEKSLAQDRSRSTFRVNLAPSAGHRAAGRDAAAHTRQFVWAVCSSV